MAEKPKRILVFGYFGYVTDQLDGQTVKTRAIYDLLKERHGGRVDFADSQQFRHSIGSVFRFFKDLARCNILVWLPAHNNLKYLFPFIWLFSKIFRFRIIYAVVGGWLSGFIESMPLHRFMLKRIEHILVENSIARDELHSKFGIDRVSVFPNFREDATKPTFRVPDGILKLVFMARVNRKKGLDEIAGLCKFLTENSPDKNITLDIYGPMHEPDREWFESELDGRFSFVQYHGAVQPQDINGVLQGYDLLLLPTRYYTEGFPGSVLDAYRAGIPVLVTAWKHAREFVLDGKSGFIVDFDNPLPELKDIVTRLSGDMSALVPMKKSAYVESLRYTPDVAWSLLRNLL